MPAEEYLVRVAGVDDYEIVSQHRAAMFRDMGLLPVEEHDPLLEATKPWIRELLDDGTYRGWFIENQSAVVAGAGLFLLKMGPVPGRFRPGMGAHIANVYTVPEHRRRGLARRLMAVPLAWCDSNQIDHVTLAASNEGRPLYESLGFTATSDMKLVRP